MNIFKKLQCILFPRFSAKICVNYEQFENIVKAEIKVRKIRPETIEKISRELAIISNNCSLGQLVRLNDYEHEYYRVVGEVFYRAVFTCLYFAYRPGSRLDFAMLIIAHAVCPIPSGPDMNNDIQIRKINALLISETTSNRIAQ